jgi:hypothetical protein
MTGAARTLLLVAAVAVPVGGLIVLEMSSVSRLDQAAKGYRQAGAAALVLDAPGLVDGRSCERLSALDGITAAGAIRPADSPLVPLATPQSSVPLYLTSPGFPAVLAAPNYGGILLEQNVARQFGVDDSSLLATALGPLAVTGTYSYPDDGRNPSLQYAALAPTAPSGRFDQCWIQVWPPDPAKRQLLYTALPAQAPADVPVSIAQLNPRLGANLTAGRDFQLRLSRWAAPTALLVGCAVTFGVGRLRRLEHALCRHLGASRADLALLLLLESLLCAIAIIALDGAVIAAVSSQLTKADPTAPFGVRVLTLGLLGCVIGAAAGGLAASERQLFRWFKNR